MSFHHGAWTRAKLEPGGWELVRQIAAAGTTVLLTTQYLEEADQLSGRIAVLDHGRIVAEGTSAQLKAQVGSGILHVRLLGWPAAIPGLRRSWAWPYTLQGPVHLGAADPLALSVPLATPADPADTGRLVGHAMTRLSEARVAVAEVTLGQPSLHEAFLGLTGHLPPAQPQPNTGTRIPRAPPTATTSRAVPEARRLDGLLAPSVPPRRAGALAARRPSGGGPCLKIKHEPKQLTDVIAIPVLITVLFTYLFGGTISGSPGSYLNILLPGTLVMGIVLVTMYGGARLAQDVTTGVFDRHCSLSVSARRLLCRGLLSDVGCYLFASAIVVVILGLIMGYRPGWRCTGCARRGSPGSCLRALLVLAVGRGRPARPRPGRRHQHRQRRADAALVRQQRLRTAPDHAGLAPSSRQRQPGQPPRDRG